MLKRTLSISRSSRYPKPSSMVSPMCTATANGEDLPNVSGAGSSDVSPSSVFPVRKVTPKQLSVAVSKRKRLSRTATKLGVDKEDTTSVDNGQVDVTMVEEGRGKRKKMTRPHRANVHIWKLRYDKHSIPERDQLVSHVSSKLGPQLSITRPFQDAYTGPSVIGMNSNDVDSCYDRLINAGFKKADAASILPYLPSCLVLDYSSIKEMCTLLSENGIGWRAFLEHHCHCLLQPIDTVRDNIHHMKAMGMTPQVMGCVLRSQPMLFSCPLNPKDVSTIMDTKAKGFNSAWVDSTVKQALLNRPAKVSLGNDTKRVAHILKQFKVSTDFVLRKDPSFFTMKATHLLSVLEVLCGQPLYLDSTLIASILTSCPHCITSITSMDELKSHLSSLFDILMVTSSVQYIIRHISRTPLLISPTLRVEDKVSLFRDAGFTTEQISVILNRAPSMLAQTSEELQTRLRCLLDLSGSSPSSLSSSAAKDPTVISARFLTNQIHDLLARVNYCKQYKPELLSIDKLDELFGTSDHQFATQVGKTGLHYLKEAIEKKWLDKKIGKERIGRLSYNNRKKIHKTEDSIDQNVEEHNIVEE